MDKKDIAIVALCFVLLVVWVVYFSPKPQPPAGPGPAQPGPAQQVPPDQGPGPDQANVPPVEPPPVVPPPPPPPAGSTAALYANLPAHEPVSLRHENVEYIFEPDRGALREARLFRYHAEDRHGEMRLGDPAEPMLGVTDADGKWRFSRARIEEQTATRLRLSRLVLGTELVVEQQWEMTAGQPYLLLYEVRLRHYGSAPLELPRVLINCGIVQPLGTPSGLFGAAGPDQKADFWRVGDEKARNEDVAAVRKLDDKDRLELASHALKGLAVENKYFTVVGLLRGEPATGCELKALPWTSAPPGTAQEQQLLAGHLAFAPSVLAPGQTRTIAMDSFIGPKEYSTLKSLGHGIHDVMQFKQFIFWNWSWMEGICLAILWSMLKLHALTGNYGIAIIIITLVLRTIFWPLTHKSTVLSRRMQAIQPLAKEIREKYKDDPQKMQMKTMELYKQHKINPLGGCLPVLLQIPVFFALFNVLRSAIELRQAQFLWASDLSLPDTVLTVVGLPINPMAVVMGVGMVYQQKIMPTSADPMQQRMMLIMSAFFTLMLYNMPSGLTLYWTVNQACSILQYKVTHTMLKDDQQGTGRATDPQPAKR